MRSISESTRTLRHFSLGAKADISSRSRDGRARSLNRRNCFALFYFQADVATNRKEVNLKTSRNKTPNSLRRSDHHPNRQEAERDQIPRTIVGKKVSQDEKNQRANNRPFDTADASNDYNEYDVRRPIGDTETCRRRYTQFLKDHERPDQSAYERRN